MRMRWWDSDSVTNIFVTTRSIKSFKRAIFGRPFVKRFTLCYRTVVLSCLSLCLSVTLVYCDETAGRIKMPLGAKVGLGPDHIVLHGEWGPNSPQRGTVPNFRPMSTVAKRSPISATAENLLLQVWVNRTRIAESRYFRLFNTSSDRM